MENQWNLGRWAGIPVAMHWTVLLTLPWMYLMLNDGLATLIGFSAFCGLLVAHEFGHVVLARRCRTYVSDIMLAGLHGRTMHGGVSRGNEILIAWGGVFAQVLILALALVAQVLLAGITTPWIWMVAGPLLWVLIKWNLFLMIVALLPIGPFDGHMAWKAIPFLREKMLRRRLGEKVVKLDAARRRELQQKSEKLTAEIIDGLSKKKLH